MIYLIFKISDFSRENATISKRARQLKKARKIQAKKLVAKNNEMDNALEPATMTEERHALYTMKFLERNIEEGVTNDFGLSDALADSNIS